MEDYVCQNQNQVRFNRILIKEAIHHVSGVRDFFKSLYHCLQPNGKVIIVTRPQHILYPIPTKAKTIWTATQPSVSVYTDALNECGLDSVNVYTHEFPVQVSKTAWIKMIQTRTWSVLSEAYFSDEELNKAIQEIDQTHGETIQFTDRLIFIVGTRVGSQ
jgi:2-polyprenyl-3-methyl-5-hydroxy-6-metoxy-1,4-benzoquinol methylase